MALFVQFPVVKHEKYRGKQTEQLGQVSVFSSNTRLHHDISYKPHSFFRVHQDSREEQYKILQAQGASVTITWDLYCAIT